MKRWNRMSYNEQDAILGDDRTFRESTIVLADKMVADIGASGAMLIGLNLFSVLLLALILWRVW